MKMARRAGRAWLTSVAALLLTGQSHADDAGQIYTRDKVVEMYSDPELEVRMLESKSWLSPTSKASFGLGFSEFYGAGGSAVLHGGERMQVVVNDLYPGFGPTGDWVTQPHYTSRMIPEAVTNDSRELTMEIVLSKLWAASILRDNMVTVFGYLLHLPDNPLSADLYTSLFYIYTDLRFKRVHTIEMIGSLPKMAFGSPHDQFLILFRELRKECPKYLSGAVEVWLDALEQKIINVDQLLQSKGGPVIVDLLVGIEPSALPALVQPIEFPPEVMKAAPLETRVVIGDTLSYVTAAIATEYLPLTQSLFALILLNRPLNDLVPQRDEIERYVVDVLRLNNVENWDEVRLAVREELKNDPYAVGRAALYKISTMKTVDQVIRKKARYLLPYLQPPVATYANPDYKLSSQILSEPAINVLVILKAITVDEYPEEVMNIRDRLEHYILKGYIDTEFIIKGFNRFDYARPISILIAFLTRIEVRLPNLPEEIMACVRYMKQVLIYKKYLSNLNPTVPKYLVDVEAIENGFSGPYIPKQVTTTVETLTEALPVESIPWTKLMETTTVQDCSLPRVCLLNVFRKILTAGYVKGHHVEPVITKLITMLDFEGNPLQDYLISKEVVNQITTTSAGNLSPLRLRRIFTANGPDTSVSIDIFKYSEMLRTELITNFSTAKQREVLYFPSKTLPVNTTYFFPGRKGKVFFTPIAIHVENEAVDDITKVYKIIPETPTGTTEDIMIRPIRLLLSHPKLYDILGSDFNPNIYKTKGLLLRAVLKKLLTTKCVQFDKVLHRTISSYVQFLESSSSLKFIVDERVPFPNISVIFYEQAPDYKNLVSLLPAVEAGTPQYFKIKPILDLLSDKDLLHLLGPGFVLTNYRTRGHLLMEILRRATGLHYVRASCITMMTIKRFIEHVEDSIIGKEAIREAPFPEMSVIFQNEPAPQTYLEAVLPVTLPGTAIHVRLRPLRKFLGRKDIKQILSGLKLTAYQKKGELLRAIVHHCLALQVVQKDVQLYSLVKEYSAHLERKVPTAWASSADFKITINVQTILHAVPQPQTEKEREMLHIIKDYMSSEAFHSSIASMVELLSRYTRGAALKAIFDTLTAETTIRGNKTVYDSISYYKDQVQMHGYGAQALELIVVLKPNRTSKFEVYSLFRALDHARLTATRKQAVARVIKFLTYEFHPQIYLIGFEPERYHTKATFLQGMLQTLLVQSTVPPEVKADIVHIYPYIITTGPGAEKVYYEPTGLKGNANVIEF